MLGDRYRKFTKWVHDRAEGETFPENSAGIPLRFISAEADKSLWHVVPVDFNSDAPKPVCQWKKRGSFFKSNVCFADSVQEALVHERPFCRNCAQFMPAGALGILEESAVASRTPLTVPSPEENRSDFQMF